MESKRCTKCGEEKPIDQFSLKNKIKGYRESRCKYCFNEYTKTHYQNNKTYYFDKAKRNRDSHCEETRRFIRDAKNRPCTDCKKLYPYYVMDFDHVANNKVKEISLMINAKFSDLKEEIAKCEVVCANCHRERTYKRAHNSTEEY